MLISADLTCRVALFTVITLFWTPAVWARTEANLCRTAAAQAAQAYDVPQDVMLAITLTETGRTRDGSVDPWPWAVNVGGQGYWFDKEDEARAFVFGQIKAGVRNFDIGCFQINHRWHGDRFASVEEMFQPLPNADYAARFLRDLYEELGTWSGAAGAYHSRTEELATRYRARFDAIRQTLDPAPDVIVAAGTIAQDSRQSRVNTFPLLKGDQQTKAISPGSLFREKRRNSK
ncbi:transglycosylase SLT domain-containing protein [Aestuariibius insulae]|uniref:transglycosylase SLT domain-containing protein n=1 Tax=Aestuariibius insulae TaxID=2058287 RepID=UPI00345E8DC1